MNIIATVGPKSIDKWIIKELVENGVETLRLNCSHFNMEDFEKVISYSKSLKNRVHILIDLSGKKVRVSEELKYIYKVYNNQEVFFCGEDYYKNLDFEMEKGKKYIPLNLTADKLRKSNIKEISMKDNTMGFKILNISNGIVRAKVLKGGIIRGGKGCNISELCNDNKELSYKDKENIKWAIENEIDIICQSFVEEREDIENIIKFIDKENNRCKKDIWAKIETPKGIENLNEILDIVDTVVIGRGDLVPESGMLNSVKLQEKAINIIKNRNKNVIIATNLLNSMKNGQLATLPEVESIYNFINLDVDGFLLAGETSIGKVPVQTVRFLKDAIDYYSVEE
ncbi:pyruvate kinase [Clostridium sp. Sa3CUN1]|uniref:Pyruvate kinase n=1 Tax=Clostridium gallinarum TaxID=2762246 RepID=A0ABR8Q458_9CLOT|nr:pyruvate kinase [Clostridium gallinarum]MBD7915217.1 pyruvate kinase [Clostridium gallinarum]